MLVPVKTAPGVRAIPLILSADGLTIPSANPLMSPLGFFSDAFHSVKLMPLTSSRSLSLQLIRIPLTRGALPKLMPVLPMVRLRAFEPDDSSCANTVTTAIRRRRREQIVFMIMPLNSEDAREGRGSDWYTETRRCGFTSTRMILTVLQARVRGFASHAPARSQNGEPIPQWCRRFSR